MLLLLAVLLVLLSLSSPYLLSSSSSSLCYSKLNRSMYNNNIVYSSNNDNLIINTNDNDDNNDDNDNNRIPEDAINAPVGPLPSVSSRINFAKAEVSKNLKYDLWIVGTGTLGTFAAKKWKEMFPTAKICGETKTTTRHEDLIKIGIEPRIRNDRSVNDEGSAKNLLICIPPSAAALYDEEINESIRLWAGPIGGGKLVFTSSIGIYGESNGNTVTETFRTDSRSQRSTKLLAVEEAVKLRDGINVRLAGLYTEQRGPHTYWLKSGKTIEGSEDGIVNMLHYEDAAGSAIAAILNGKNGATYLACDDDPVTRKEICEAALESGLFPSAIMPTFESVTGARGKVCDGSWTRKELKWKPLYPSFDEYMRKTIGKKPYKPRENSYAALQAKKEAAASVLWMPGDDDDFGL